MQIAMRFFFDNSVIISEMFYDDRWEAYFYIASACVQPPH